MANASIPHVSEEEENYLRMDLMLSSISPRAVRVLFDKEFHPSCLEASIKKECGKLNDLKKKRVINAAHWNLLFPRSGVPNSTNFDVTLIATLIRNLTTLPTPSCGYDKLPLSTDISATADLARIKYYRNKLAHINDGKLKSAVFASEWEDISGAVQRLGGTRMGEECKDLRSKRLDQSTVPWNIRVQISQILDQWRKSDLHFVPTTAAQKVLECVLENSCVTITASSGVGKTATLQHVVLKMANEGYDVLLVTNPQDIFNFFNPNKKMLFVIDDFCGTYSINPLDFHYWEPVIERMEELIQNKLMRIIVACRLQVYNDEKFKSLSMFRTNVCNLLTEDFILSQREKQSIAEMYLKTEGLDIIQYSDLFHCFPLLCKLYHDNPIVNITDFFQNPFSVYEAEVKQLKTNGLFSKYCALALCVVFNNALNQEVLTGDINEETRNMIENTFEACRLSKKTPRLTLLDELNSIEHTFIKKDQGVYKTVHDKLFDFLSYYFGKKMIQCIIKNAHFKLINGRFLLEREKDMDQFITIVPPKYHQMYMERMVYDWYHFEVVTVFNNKNMDSTEFRQRYLCYLNTLDISYQQQLAQTCDNNTHDTVLLQCCFIGDIPFIQWCLYHCVDVNMCRYNGMSPLYVSSQEGHTDVVQILLDNNADINKCTDDGSSPLYVACRFNHVAIVRILLDNKADMFKFRKNGATPLAIACENGYSDTAKLLLDNKDINIYGTADTSPLYMDYQQNHLNTAKQLLANKAGLKKCLDTGTYSLFMACQLNHVDIVKLLIEYEADVNKCMNDETSPLYIACQKNNFDIVQLLLDHKADVNKGTDNEASPLFIACQKNFVDIVKLLLENKADINKCMNDEASPLFIACMKNHVDIVKLLLDNKADINKCRDDGLSPIFAACYKGHKDLVKILLAKGADYNKCVIDGDSVISPKQIAIHQGFDEIVTLISEHSIQNQSKKACSIL